MQENTKRNSKDFSVYDNMATEELEMLLLADIESDNQTTDMEVLCYIMDLVAKREEESGIPQKTLQEAYAEFREKYLYSDDPADAECIEEETEQKPQNKTLRLHRFGKSVTRAAVIIIAVLALSATLAVSVDAFRIPIINYFNTHFPDHSMWSFTQDTTKYYPHNDITSAIQDAPVPAQYELVGQIIEDRIIMLSYSYTDSAYMMLSISPMQAVIKYDTEDMTATEMTIEGHDAIFYQKDNILQVVWVNEECEVVYLLTTNCLSEDRFWEVAHYWAIQHIKLSEG